MIVAGGEWGNKFTLFATGLLACSWSARGKQNASGINGKCGGTGFKTGDGRAATFMCACGRLSASGALTRAFKSGERGELTVRACSTCEGIDDLTVNHRSALLLQTVIGLCLGR